MAWWEKLFLFDLHNHSFGLKFTHCIEPESINYLDLTLIGNVIAHSIESEDKIPRESFLVPKKIKHRTVKSKDNENHAPVTTKYSNQFSQISDIIKKYLPMLDSDPAFSIVLNEGTRYVAKKSPHNCKHCFPMPDKCLPTISTYLVKI